MKTSSVIIMLVLCFISSCLVSLSYGIVELGDTSKTSVETIKDISKGNYNFNRTPKYF